MQCCLPNYLREIVHGFCSFSQEGVRLWTICRISVRSNSLARMAAFCSAPVLGLFCLCTCRCLSLKHLCEHEVGPLEPGKNICFSSTRTPPVWFIQCAFAKILHFLNRCLSIATSAEGIRPVSWISFVSEPCGHNRASLQLNQNFRLTSGRQTAATGSPRKLTCVYLFVPVLLP